MAKVKVSIVMGSKSDRETMVACEKILDSFNVPYECLVVSAHRTPLKMVDYATQALSRGITVIIAAAGGAAHLPGMIASMTVLPVIGVPIQSKALNGVDSLYSIVQMPGGVPVATMAIGQAGAKNAAYLAISILALEDKALQEHYRVYKEELAASVWENQFQ